MTIQFNFSLPDDEAELLFDVVREAADKARQRAREFKLHGERDEAEWCDRHAACIDSIANQMLNTRCDK